MTGNSDDVGLALLAALEAKAKKSGKKSIVNAVLRRLRDSGASEQVLGQVAALHGKRRSNERPVKTKQASNGKATSKTTKRAKAAKLDTPALHA
jgi:hypothetical protein